MKATVWKPEHDAALCDFIISGDTFAVAARRINALFGTQYSRNACISRGGRIGLCTPKKKLSTRVVMTPEQRIKRQAEARKAKRWAENPSLAYREQRARERKANRERSLSYGSKTSAAYRKYLPKLGDVSKSELRSMLTAAVQNTANMGAT